MKPSQALRATEYLIDNQLAAFLWGPPGVGKSALPRQIAAARKIDFIDKRLAQSDPTEIKGYPWPDSKKGVMTFLQDGGLPTKGKGILFLDEFSHAPPAVQAVSYQLVLDRRLGDYELPDGWAIIAAGNRISDRSFVGEMSAALSSRFIHVNVEPDVEDFITWAMKNGVNDATRGYLRWRPGNLATEKFTAGMRGFPTPRTWVKADKIAHDPSLPQAMKTELLIGTIGEGVALEYEGFIRDEATLPDVAVILATPDKAPIPTEPATQHAVVTRLEAITTAKNLGTLLKYMARVNKEFEVIYMKSVTERDKDLIETSTATKWLQENHGYLV